MIKSTATIKKNDARKQSSSEPTRKGKAVDSITITKDGVVKTHGDIDFRQMQQEIARRIADYDRIRKECDIKDPARSATIHRLAIPFLEGHFTLAVVGKMSSGKSTFINTLVGDNLFPTGRLQTTSVITYIEKGDELKVDVLFCDGSKRTISGKGVKEELESLVAVPDKYRDLPIYHINLLISGGDNLEEILKKKELIEENTDTKADRSLWEEYINTHSKKDIAKEVHVFCRLPEAYQGWRIIDTPGIGGIGGIQEATKKILMDSDGENKKIVDAIIYLHDGTDNIEDEESLKFMKMIVKNLTDDAKKRLFFVLTKASSSDFRANHFEIMQRAKEIYGDEGIGIVSKRITFIDSLLERFNNEVKDKKDFYLLECPPNWNEKEWNQMTDLYTPILKRLNGKKPENEVVANVMEEWANFKQLKSMLNEFMTEEKSAVYEKIVRFVEEDCLGFKTELENFLKLLEGKKDLQKAKDELVQEKNKHNQLLNELRRKATIGFVKPRFGFVDERINMFKEKESIDLIRTAFLQLQDEVDEKEKQILGEFRNGFEEYCSSAPDEHVTFGQVDFDELERQAKELSLVLDKDRPKNVVTEKGCCWKDDKIRTFYPYKKEDAEKKRIEFAALVVVEARRRKREYLIQLEAIIDKYCELIGTEIDRKYQEANKQLDEIEKQMGKIEKQLEGKNSHMEEIRSKIETINGRWQKGEQ